jgi:hypothetical protein
VRFGSHTETGIVPTHAPDLPGGVLVGTRYAKLWFWGLSMACAVLCILILFRPFFTSHFDLTLSDPVDGRFGLTVLEHWNRAFHRQVRWDSPNFFFPEQSVLGYSDAFFLIALPYAGFRFAGLDRYLAFEITMMFLALFGFASMLYLLRKVLRTTCSTAVLGATLFVCANMYYINIIVHPHLGTVLFIPLLMILAIKFVQNRNANQTLARLYICSVGLLLALVLFTAFYIGWFFLVACATGFFFLVICRVIIEQDTEFLTNLGRAAWQQRVNIALGLSVFLAAMIPFLIIYLPALHRTGTRSLEYTRYFMPSALGVFDVGRYNFIWGRLAGRIEQSISPDGMHEHPLGWPIVTASLFLFATIQFALRFLRFRTETNAPETQKPRFILVLALTCLSLWLVGVRLGNRLTLWWLLWKWVPGASAIRIPHRVNLVLNVAVVIVCMFGFEELMRVMAQYRIRRYLVAITLAATIFVEQLNFMPTHLVSRTSEWQKLSRISSPPKTCSEFYVSTWNDSRVRMMEFQLDAMLLAQKYTIPTLNGYSSWFPEDWDLLSGTKRRIAEDANEWMQRHGVTRGLCTLDINSGTWSDVRVSSSPLYLGELLTGSVANSGFENSGLSPWVPFQIDAKISSAVAHSGIHSVSEASGDGGVYQDLKGLKPGEIYTVSAWIIGSSGGTATAQLGIYDPDTNTATFSGYRTPKESWQTITMSTKVSHAGTIRIHLFRRAGSGTIYWDDVNLYHDK